MGPGARGGAAAGALGLASAAAAGGGGGRCAWWLLLAVLLRSQEGLAIALCGSVWWIVLRGALLRQTDRDGATARGPGRRAAGLHLGDGLHGLRGSARGLVQAEVLGRRLLLLADGGQLCLGEDVFGDGAPGAARGGRAVAGPRLPEPLLWILLGGMSLSGKRLQVTGNNKKQLRQDKGNIWTCESLMIDAIHLHCGSFPSLTSVRVLAFAPL